MSFGKMILGSSILFPILLATLTVHALETELFSTQQSKFEMLKDSVQLRDGRTVSDRIRICSTVAQCRVFIIDLSEQVPMIEDVIASIHTGEITGGVRVTFVRDQNLKELKLLRELSIQAP